MQQSFLQDNAIAPDNSSTDTRRDRLLEATAIAANTLLTTDNFDAAVNTALQILGEALDTDRVNVIETFDSPSESPFPCWRALGYEWNSPGTVPQFADLDAAQGSYEQVQWLYELFQQGQTASYVIEESPEPFRSTQIAIGVKSTILVPIFVEGQWWGVLGLDDCREAKRRSVSELAALQIAANCLGSAIQRERTQQALLQAEQERFAELERANTALQNTVASLANSRDLEGFIGEVLHTIAHEFDAPLVEYWTILGTDTVEVDTWICGDQRFSLRQGDEHPSQGGIRLLKDYIGVEDFTQRNQVFMFDAPMPAYSFALEEIICPTDWYAARGVSNHFNFPLQVGNSTIGSISVWLPSDRQISDDSLRLGQALSHQTALAIQLTRLADEAKQVAIAREQEKAAKEQAAELAKANDVLARASSRLTDQPDLNAFLGHITLEATAQLGANAAHIMLFDEQREVFSTAVLVEKGCIVPASMLAAELPVEQARIHSVMQGVHNLRYVDLETEEHLFWQGSLEYHRQRNHRTVLVVPLNAGRKFLGYLGLAFIDSEPISEQKTELLQALAHQAALAIQLTQLAEEAKQAAILDERNRMAQDVHDTLAQSFTGVIMQLEATKRKISNVQPDLAQEHIARARSLAQAGLSEARRSVRALRPESLESNDLPEALHHLAIQMTCDTSAQILVEITGTPYPLPIDLEINLLRIAQEAVTNALRHAEPQSVHLQLQFTPTALRLSIIDDGQGFDPDSQIDLGFGLLGMQERSQRINGEFSLSSTIGQGTEIVVVVSR
jgi:signal transduction histidine kinase